MKKIKWVNILKLVATIPCVGLILHDVFVIFISGQASGWTWFGFATFIFAWFLLAMMYDNELNF